MLSRSIGKAISKHLQTANGDDDRRFIRAVILQQFMVILRVLEETLCIEYTNDVEWRETVAGSRIGV